MVTYYFTADWCGPCKTVRPLIESSGRGIQIVDIGTDKELVNRYNIRSIPAVIVANGDTILESHIGAPSIQRWLTTK